VFVDIIEVIINNYKKIITMTKYIKTIGLEIHMRLKSKTKMFCGCKNSIALETEANKNVCPVCM